MSAMGAAISGLQSSQKWLDVISNNVSNSQTIAFKSGRTTFANLISEGLGAASGPSSTSNLGGINPVQLGVGVTVSTIQTEFTQGAVQVTGNATDVAIEGNGFMTVKKGSTDLYTRAGNLTVDASGNLVTSDGGLVQGWSQQVVKTNDQTVGGTFRLISVTNKLDTSNLSKIGSIQIPDGLTIPPKQTSVSLNPSLKTAGVIVQGNLDEATPGNAAAQAALGPAGLGMWTAGGVGTGINAAVAGTPGIGFAAITGAVPDPFASLIPDTTSNTTVYDSVGQPHSVTIQYYQIGDTAANPAMPPQWAWYAFDTTTVTGSPVYTGTPSALNLLGGTGINTSSAFNANDPNKPLAANLPNGFISFNADGSLQTNGGLANLAATVQDNPILAISNAFQNWNAANPVLGSEGFNSSDFTLNFGTADIFTNAGASSDAVGGFGDQIQPNGNGLRDGLTGDYGNGTTTIVAGVPTYQPNSTPHITFQDGYSEGLLTGVSFDQTGTINGTFSNGQNLALAQLAMATFTNNDGLESVGGNYFQTTINSGNAVVSTAGKNGFGTIQGGAVEASNVDLTVELTNMILAQRMFESNARVVTSADKVLDTLVHLGQ